MGVLVYGNQGTANNRDNRDTGYLCQGAGVQQQDACWDTR